MTTAHSANEIRIVRLYDAPLKAVWEAWTDPKQTAQWWGPRGFSTSTQSKEVRVGGCWTFTMQGPDATEYPNCIRYLEVEPLAKLVYDHGTHEDQAPLFRVKVQFSERQGKTTMDMVMILPSAEAAAETRKHVKKAGGETTWDRLAEFLSKELAGKELFVIHRSFEGNVERLYQMWTDTQHFSHWMAPSGASHTLIRADLRMGGSMFYCMSMPGGLKMYGRLQYQELLKPQRLVYTQQFVDQDEKVQRHPMAPTWPETMQTRVSFAAEDGGKTRVTLIWEPVGPVTAEELQTFIAGRAGMSGGWTGTFDKLEEYLASCKV